MRSPLSRTLSEVGREEERRQQERTDAAMARTRPHAQRNLLSSVASRRRLPPPPPLELRGVLRLNQRSSDVRSSDATGALSLPSLHVPRKPPQPLPTPTKLVTKRGNTDSSRIARLATVGGGPEVA